ncbi:SDR family oxidoreductase [Jannaschia sp. Os4]|uniref:SDR family oxidoreductase n=1 Tax=Jannaschia sp. Os4 TaxID=2807617 RepID=UPI00193A5974|nr:SDR family oxidoreductase [Jannaschia sp. Os4]MBM2574762.1 SDR family oxidoreductase [Jannaschia sp. Os4]
MTRSLVLGASGGIGAALAARLGREGDVVGLSRSGDGLDVTDAEAVDRVLGALDPAFDVVMVATGILAPEGHAPEKALDAIDANAMARTFAVNAIGPALVLRHMPRLLAPGGRVGVLTARVGSIGDNRMGGWYSYRAAKAAANQVVRTASVELARRVKGSVVAALHPGTVETPFTEGYKAKKLSPEESADRLIGVLLGLEETGVFRDWKGEAVEW